MTQWGAKVVDVKWIGERRIITFNDGTSEEKEFGSYVRAGEENLVLSSSVKRRISEQLKEQRRTVNHT